MTDPLLGPGGGQYRRTHSQSRFSGNDFPSFFHSSQGGGGGPRRTSMTTGTGQGTQGQQIQPPPPYYSSHSLGQNFRSRSLDHRRFPAFSAEASSPGDRAIYSPGGFREGRQIYTSGAGGGGRGGAGQYYTGELFAGGGGAGAGKVDSASSQYKSSSTERSGVTVVPIRREATLPARRYQSEWKSEWKSGEGGVGFGGDQMGQMSKLKQTGDADEHEFFERSSKFSHHRENWAKPQQNIHDRWTTQQRMEMIEAPPPPKAAGYYHPSDTTTADYSTFRRGTQAEREAAAAAAAAQHQKHEQHTRTQQHQREVREWHSGDRHQHRSAAAGGEHYGTLGTRRSATERQARNLPPAGYYQQQQQQQYAAYGVGGAGGGHQRYQNYQRQHHEQQQQQQQKHYANGWAGREPGVGAGGYQYHQQHMRRSASAGGDGFFGTGQKSKSSKSSAARWSRQQEYGGARPPKRYRKIRVCCFNLIWPPWAVEPSGPPKPLYGRSRASGPPSPIPLEHRPFYGGGPPPPPQQQQYQQGVATYDVPPPGPGPHFTVPVTQGARDATGAEALPNDVAGAYHRGPPGVPEPPHYREPPADYRPVGGGGDQGVRAGVVVPPTEQTDYRVPPTEVYVGGPPPMGRDQQPRGGGGGGGGGGGHPTEAGRWTARRD